MEELNSIDLRERILGACVGSNPLMHMSAMGLLALPCPLGVVDKRTPTWPWSRLTPLGHMLCPHSGLRDCVRPCPSPDYEGHKPVNHE